MKILFITPMSPLEVGHGGAVRTRFLWEALRREGVVYTSSLIRGDDTENDDVNNIHYYRVFNGIKSKIAVTKLALMSAVLPRMNWAFHDREYILEKLGWPGEKFDKVVVRLPQFMSVYWWLFFCAAYWKIAPLYVDIDDLPSEDFKTTKRPHMSPKRGLLYYWLNVLWQSFLYRMSKGAWVANQFQRNWVRPFCKCMYLPNVAHVPANEPVAPNQSNHRLLIVGFMGHGPNVFGLNWFLENIWPAAKDVISDLELIVVGSKISDELRDKWGQVPGVTVKGFVENIDDAYNDCAAVVVPILTGGGTCVKLIEALAHGKKVFATPFGARGLSDKQIAAAQVSLFENSDQFQDGISSFLASAQSEKERLTIDARSMIQSEYSADFFNCQVKKLITR